MSPVLACRSWLVVAAFFCLVSSTAFAQSKQHRPDEISGGAEASLLVPRVRDVFPFATSPTRGPEAAGFLPGIGFLAYNFDDNIIEAGVMMIPPDPCGAAGPDRLISVVNVGIECRDKVGNLLFRDSLRDFFLPLGPQTLGTVCFDPKVVFDHHAGRFVVVALERWFTSAGDPSNESRILMAVSTTPAPGSATPGDWYFMAIDSKMNIAGIDYWADYPGFEVDEEAVYLTMNMFPFAGGNSLSRLWIIDKGLFGGFYTGGPAAWAVYDPIPVGYYHMTLMPALVFGPGAGPGVGTYLVGYSSLTNGGPGASEFVQVIRVDNPLALPTFTGEFVNVGDLENVGGVYGFPAIPDAPQSGGPVLIEVNDSRALDAVWRNNSLWFTTTTRPNVANDPVNANQATAHWFRLDTSAVPAPITVADQGNIGGEDIAPATRTFFPSVAVNANNDAKFGFAASAPSLFGSAFFAGREANDPPGTVQAAVPVKVGLDYYVRTFGGGRNRWGDYSGAAVDPADDLTFWIFNEYAEVRGTPTPTPPEDGRWGTAWKSCIGTLTAYDFGDLPDPGAPGYPTLLASNGARHAIAPGVYMGGSIDAEPDGQTSPPNAVGDDANGADDEDGVTFPYFFIVGHTSYAVVLVSQDGWLNVWFDWNGNGILTDPGEAIYSGAVTAGFNYPSIPVPMTAPLGGYVFSRFRYNLTGPLGVAGAAPNGEVEDYMISTFPVDYGDAPSPYPTLLANDGPRHVYSSPLMYMGATIDWEPNGQPHASALGDDAGSPDDEDGVTFTTPLDPTHVASVTVSVNSPGYIHAWIDFNSDGAWSLSEKIINAAPVVAGPNVINFAVPGTSGPAYSTFARFRFGSNGGAMVPTGLEPDGEVEDYQVNILEDTVTPVAGNSTPQEFALFDPMPNPFNPSTTLSFALPVASHVQLSVFNVRGELVTTVLDENRGAGMHRVTWDGHDNKGQPVASGVYLYRIKAGSFTDTKRMVLLK